LSGLLVAVDISPVASKSPEFAGSLIMQTANRRAACHRRIANPASMPAGFSRVPKQAICQSSSQPSSSWSSTSKQPRLHGLAAETKASIDGRMIHNQQV
jgi:hypothetical protein